MKLNKENKLYIKNVLYYLEKGTKSLTVNRYYEIVKNEIEFNVLNFGYKFYWYINKNNQKVKVVLN